MYVVIDGYTVFSRIEEVCSIVYIVDESIGSCLLWWCFCFQAEDGIRYLVRSRGLGDVYKRQV